MYIFSPLASSKRVKVVISSVRSLGRWGRRGDTRDDSGDCSLFLQEALVSSSGIGQRCPLFDVVHPTFPLLTMALPTLQGALKDGFGEAGVACDVPEPCKFPPLDIHCCS